MALRRRRTASSISSRYGSHALALGDLPGGGGGAGPLGEPGAAARRGGCSVAESVDTSPPLAGFDPAESVDTSLAGFGAWPHRRRAIAMPASFRYALAVSRRTPMLVSMRRSGHPSRPNAMTCCRFCSLKTFAIPAARHASSAYVNVLAHRFPLAGFQVSTFGRFWVSTEEYCGRLARGRPRERPVLKCVAASRTVPPSIERCYTTRLWRTGVPLRVTQFHRLPLGIFAIVFCNSGAGRSPRSRNAITQPWYCSE